jgi:hypothetical protein
MLILIPATADPPATNALAETMGYAGFFLWTVAYGFFIWQGRRDQTYGVPLVAVCLNFTWELYFAALCPLVPGQVEDLCTATGMVRFALILWLVLDTVILWQLFKYGWRSEPNLLRFVPERGRRPIFYVFLYVFLLVSLYWQYAFVNLFTDQDGNSLAWLTNYIMAWLFVSSAFFRRPDARGLSYWGGWAMLGGNAAFVVKAVVTDFAEFTAWPQQFTVALMFGVIMVNLFYLFVLRYKTRSAESIVPSFISQPLTS